MRVTESFSRSTLSTDDIKKIIDSAARQDFRFLSLTGGEPLLDVDRLVELISYAGKSGIPYIRTGTNGFMFRDHEKSTFQDRVSELADKLCSTPLRTFWISMDSHVPEIHEKMRGFKGVITGIEKALPVFHRAGIFPSVNLGINRNVGGKATGSIRLFSGSGTKENEDIFYNTYKKAFEDFFQRAVDLGFTISNSCYPMSIDESEPEGRDLNAVYHATALSDIVHFSSSEKNLIFKALEAAIKKYRSKIRIFTPLFSLEALINRYAENGRECLSYGCRGGVDFFYINASDGNIYPCGYRGNDNYGRLQDLDINRIPVPSRKTACRLCDWECFHDPSEMLGPVFEMLSNPVAQVKEMLTGRRNFFTWLNDFRYYSACDFFNGRKAPDYNKLKKHSQFMPA